MSVLMFFIVVVMIVWISYRERKESGGRVIDNGPTPRKYVATYHCKKCRHELTDNERAYSRGVCPYCGNVSNSTFVDCTKKAKEIK